MIYKIDLRRAYRQLPVDPKDYSFLGFTFNGQLYFDLRCPFGLSSSAMICQRTTKGVIYIFNCEGFSADVYLDDFFGAETPEFADTAFLRLQALLGELGLQTSADKDLPPSTDMLCLGIQVNTTDLTLRVPDFRITELSQELHSWLHKSRFTKKQLQALLGKLSFVTACVKPGRIFMARLLNSLRRIHQSTQQYMAVTSEMRDDIHWWCEFLPLFNGVAAIKPSLWDFQDLRFTTDACLDGGGATCFNECISFQFPRHILQQSLHISALELWVVLIATRVWAAKLSGLKFIVSCDNEAAVTSINSGKSRDPCIQQCLRQLWMLAATFDFEIRAQYIQGEHNVLADCLSRWHKSSRYQEQFIALARTSSFTFTHIQVDKKYFCSNPV